MKFVMLDHVMLVGRGIMFPTNLCRSYGFCVREVQLERVIQPHKIPLLILEGERHHLTLHISRVVTPGQRVTISIVGHLQQYHTVA